MSILPGQLGANRDFHGGNVTEHGTLYVTIGHTGPGNLREVPVIAAVGVLADDHGCRTCQVLVDRVHETLIGVP